MIKYAIAVCAEADETTECDYILYEYSPHRTRWHTGAIYALLNYDAPVADAPFHEAHLCKRHAIEVLGEVVRFEKANA